MIAASPALPGGPDGPRRKPSPFTFGRLLAGVGVGLAVALIYNMLSWEAITERPNEIKTTQVILPPPPPPPPPEPKPVEQPPEPTIAPPIEQPVDTPPPPDQANHDPAPGDNALTAREGAGPSNYGLAAGDGSGTRIGGPVAGPATRSALMPMSCSPGFATKRRPTASFRAGATRSASRSPSAPRDASPACM